MDAHEIQQAATEELEQEPLLVPSHKKPDPETISDFEMREGDSNMVMASPVPLPNRVRLLYKDYQILNIIFGILIGSIAAQRWYTGRAEFDITAILICLVDSSMLVLPQSMIGIYCFFQKGSCVGLEPYIWTGAMVLDDYVALLMINKEYIRIVMIPVMILVFIGTLGWKLRESGTVKVGSSGKDHDGVNTVRTEKHKTNEEIPSVERTDSSDKLELFGFVSYLLQLSLVTWTQYKGQQGCTPVLSDFLLFLGSALGALGVMLASPLAGVDSGVVSAEVLPVLHKTCIVVLFIAVHTLAAEWLGDDTIYVCLPELITVLVWFTVCFGESTSVSSFTSYKSQATIVSSVVAILACLIPWNANDRNMPVSWIMWLFWISTSSVAFSRLHVWLLHGWPGSSSESNKLIPLLKVVSTVGSITGILLLYAYIMFDHKALAAVVAEEVAIIFLLFPLSGHLEIQTGRILLMVYLRYVCTVFLLYIPRKVSLWCARFLRARPQTASRIPPPPRIPPSGVREDVTFLQSKQKDMRSVITNATVPEKVGTLSVSKYEINPEFNVESDEILEEKAPYRKPEHESEEILEEQKPRGIKAMAPSREEGL